MQKAFSLVELSIVLVILGLLTGGILAGQSLIHAAELRAVSTERDRYLTALGTFRDKYFALPGDMTNASKFWGAADGSTGSTPGCATATAAGTCNGDGNGRISPFNQPTNGESLRIWQHLALAGLIEGSYTGYLNGGTNLVPGENMPRSKFPNAVWNIFYRESTNPNPIYGYSGNLMYFSKAETGPSVWDRVMKPEDAWNLDTKMDDGRPGLGAVMAGGDSTICVLPNVIDYDAAAAAAASTITYNLTETSTNACRLWFKL